MIKNLILTGMMGVGKSTIGKSLAVKLSYNYIDVDKIIEELEGCSIKTIFKIKSEKYFRELEKKTTLELLKKSQSVIALGGGAFLDRSIRNAVKNSCISFWLDVNINILIKRLSKSEKRPLLFKKNKNDEVKKIYYERMKTYSEADFRIKCDSMLKDEIINKILKLYEKSRNKI